MTNKIETSWGKEQRKLALCRKLVVSQRYSSQEEIRHQMMRSGYQGISQSTVSRLLKMLGVMKVQNAKGKKVYSLNALHHPAPDINEPLSAMLIDVEHNDKFVLIHMNSGYAKAMARIIDLCAWPAVLGVIASSNVVWIAPRDTRDVAQLHQRLLNLLESNAGL
ncbi:ArgR family transcriptional regulator [Serratia proteamaculans]|jgi:arginine repressor|uniref:arginine repressor n=1 Tax=Serratia TaxID=613 RepID=UPI0015762CE8|nr:MULTISPECIES: ArgR family transcriptional regulator [Serratia]NTX80276.1 ArgR family transcriptional regulator [Serratia proteamaculans]NTZ29301.1 ArgR family transcriptional regulator [Serratia proteamaculans]CAI1793728.1 Arginine repressor [Serratia quinivorans]CAI1961001.1 Arginine repressor [Serratia quinivorans]CAI2124523.1 Arginine repressor [Serratia quinivorans]